MARYMQTVSAMATRTRKAAPLATVQPLSAPVLDGFELVAMYPAGTQMAQVGSEWTSDYKRSMWHGGQRWIVRSLVSGDAMVIVRFWSPDLKPAA